jgi:hypothetical protein
MNPPKFWRLDHPDYESDYAHTFINGSLTHPFSLPGVICPICKQTWGGSRILPYQCSESLRRRKEIRNPWPIPLADHKKLQAEVITALRSQGFEIDSLKPGDYFQPCYLDIPSRPRAYYELIVLNESGYPPGGTPKSICSGCGRPEIDNMKRRIVMTPEMWKGDKIFFLSTTLHVIVTNELKELLERNNPTNMVFKEI